jgi:putative membrane protein
MPDLDPLARDPRVALAEERTLLAWIRTGLALMGFGFVVARFGVFLRELSATVPSFTTRSTGLSVWIGAVLVALGVLVNLAAALQHVWRLRRLAGGRLFQPRPIFGVAVSIVLAAIGIAMTAYLVVLSG